MNDDIDDDDDDIFYGGGKPKDKKEEDGETQPEPEKNVYAPVNREPEPKKKTYEAAPYRPEPEKDVYAPVNREPKKGTYEAVPYKPEPRGTTSHPTPEDAPAREEERDIESEITETRHDKQMAAELHDITKLRQKAAEHSAEAAKFFKNYRAEEAAMVKYTENASKARRTAEGYLEKSKNALAKADDKQADLEFLEDRKAERARIKIAKLQAKSAKMKSKASSYMAKSAKLSQKSAAKREKAKAYLEKSKTHEAESQNLNRRATRLQKTMA